MPRLIGVKKINIAVFISGTGSNLKNLIKHSLKKNSKFQICLVISNKSKAKGLNYARRYKIKKKVINYSKEINLDGLIYWHYWFGNDFNTLEKVQEEHLRNKKIKQNFCFAWANGDWTKSWQGDNNTMIFKQTYSQQSAIKHYEYVRNFFLDERYLKQNNNFLFQVNNGVSNDVLEHLKILDKLCFNEFRWVIH